MLVLLSSDSISVLHKMINGERLAEVLPFDVEEAVCKAEEQYDVLFQFLVDLGFTETVSPYHLTRWICHLSLLNLLDRGEAYLKWKFAHIACVCFSQEEYPTIPTWASIPDQPHHLIGGSAGRFLRHLQHHRSLFLGWNLCQLKKGMPLVSQSMVDAAVTKTVTALTTAQARLAEPSGLDWTDVLPEEPSWESLENPVTNLEAPFGPYSIEHLAFQARRTAAEIYRQNWYDPQNIYVPSISAHFSVGRKHSGALGALVRSRTARRAEREEEEQIAHDFSGGYRPPHTIVLSAPRDAEVLFIDCTGREARFCGCCGWMPEDSIITLGHTMSVQDVIRDTLDYEQSVTADQENFVKPMGLKEPFKVRVITGGPEGRYYRAKYIQKATHSHLRRKPYAALIGELIGPKRLDERLWQLGENDFYVSGDYTAATDNLHPALSEAVALEISARAGWSDEVRDLYIDSLTRHSFDGVQQKWGQLMGSPTSFPVLCIANLALSRYALELRYGTTISLDESGILINGDDIGFVTDASGYELWKKITSCGGLSPSLGKNFCSRDFIVLNSTFYKVGESSTGSRNFEYMPYINYGLLKCRNGRGQEIRDLAQSLPASGDPRTQDIGALAHDLVLGHPEVLQVTLLKRFLEAWGPSLKKFCPRGMSYYLPRHLGGLGLPSIGTFSTSRGAGEQGRYSRMQLVMASFLAEDPERQNLLQSPASIGRSESLSLWKRVQPVQKRLLQKIGFTWTKEKKEGPAREGPLNSILLANAYAGLTPEEVKQVEDDGEENRYKQWRKSYEKLFDRACASTFPPIAEEDIPCELPWRRVLDDYEVTDTSYMVDLRNTFANCVVQREMRRTTCGPPKVGDDACQSA